MIVVVAVLVTADKITRVATERNVLISKRNSKICRIEII